MTRVLACFLVVLGAFLVGLCGLAEPAGALSSTSTSSMVFDEATGSAWTGTETVNASAYDTASVQAEVTPTGQLTYQFFEGGSCDSTPLDSDPVTLNPDGTVPSSNVEGPLAAGTYSFQADYAGDSNNSSSDSPCEPFAVRPGTPTSPVITNIPAPAIEFGSFVADVATNGDGPTSVTSSTPDVCTVGPDGSTVTFVAFGSCSLTADLANGSNYVGATGTLQTFTVGAAPRGYWLVGSDGGIFDFGAAGFFGSMGGSALQRPVVGITPTETRQGYWLDASDGGVFAFGDAGFYGSIPGLGLHPAGSRLPGSLDAPIVGMVPSRTGHGYFMVGSDGGVFAFGDAQFEGSCPGIGGCAGSAVAVMPDHTGDGYWLVTSAGAVYAFGDARFLGAPAPQTVAVVDAVATPDGNGYWILYANGAVAAFGDAPALGGPVGYVNVYNPATAIFPVADGHGYWVGAARGDVFSYGDAPFLGGMAATSLNGSIIAADGF
jgi:hypothetical protein